MWPTIGRLLGPFKHTCLRSHLPVFACVKETEPSGLIGAQIHFLERIPGQHG